MKKPFSISIDKKLAEWIDFKVIRGRLRNRSHLVEIALLKFKEKLQIQREDELLKEKIRDKLEESILRENLNILEKDIDSYKKELEDKLKVSKKELLKRLKK